MGDDLTVTAVIDFGMFQGGPPISDFARDVGQPGFDTRRLRDGYGGEAWASRQAFERELALASLNKQMGHVAHQSRTGNQEEAGRVAHALTQTLATLRRLG